VLMLEVLQAGKLLQLTWSFLLLLVDFRVTFWRGSLWYHFYFQKYSFAGTTFMVYMGW
jgi:hypothetical protein